MLDTSILIGNTFDVTVAHPYYTNTLEDDDAYDICVICPAVLVEVTKIFVSVDNIVWSTLQDKVITDVTLSAGKATVFDPGGLLWRIQTAVAATNNYTFQVVKRIFVAGPSWNG